MKNSLLDDPLGPAWRARRAALGRLCWPAAAWAAPGLLLAPPLQAAEPLRLTPAQTEGPFYPVELPPDTDFDLLSQRGQRYARGQPVWLDGTLLDTAGQPVAGAAVEIWQCDADGHYRHPGDGNRADPAFQAFGRVQVGDDGRWRFRTLRPVAYSGRTPHIHLKVRLGPRTLLTTQLYVAGDAGNARDGLWRSLRDPRDRAALTLPFVTEGDGLRASCVIVVAA